MARLRRGAPDDRVVGGIVRARIGPDAFHQVVDENFPAVFNYLARRVGRESARDLAAETFATAFRRWEHFDPTHGSPRAWIFGIASNILANHRRAEIRRLDALSRESALRVEATIDNVDERVQARQDLARLVSVMRELEPSARDELLLVSLGDLTFEEAAAALGVPVGTLKARIWRTRRRLRAAMDDLEKGRHTSTRDHRIEGCVALMREESEDG